MVPGAWSLPSELVMKGQRDAGRDGLCLDSQNQMV